MPDQLGRRTVTWPGWKLALHTGTSMMDECPAQENQLAMIEFDYTPVVIEAHRNDLRKLYNPAPAGTQVRTNRQRLGATIVRLGYWIGDLYYEVATDPPVTVSSQQARA